MNDTPPTSDPKEERVGIHPKMLIRSYFLVSGCYLLFLMMFVAFGLGLGLLLDGGALIEKLQPENYHQQGGDDFDTLFSRTWSWGMLALGTGLAFGVGYLVSRFANFSPFGHGVMLAVLFLITCLNTFFNNADVAPYFFRLTMLGFYPLATVFGAKYAEIKMFGIDPTEQA